MVALHRLSSIRDPGWAEPNDVAVVLNALHIVAIGRSRSYRGVSEGKGN